MHYEVRLDKATLQQTRDFIEQFFSSLPTATEKHGRLPEGTFELIESLITRGEDDWVREAVYFETNYGSITCFDNRLLKPITRLTAAVEASCRCNHIVSYGRHFKPMAIKNCQQQFDVQAARLLGVICKIAEGLQKKDLKNGMGAKDAEILRVRKQRLRYAAHLAELGMTIRQHYFRNAPQGVWALDLHAQTQRNLAAILIDIARTSEGQKAEVNLPAIDPALFQSRCQSLQQALNRACVVTQDGTINILIACGLERADQIKVASNELLYSRLIKCLPYQFVDGIAQGKLSIQLQPSENGLDCERDLHRFVESMRYDEL